MTVNKALKKLITRGKIRLDAGMGTEILIKKNLRGGYIVYYLDMFYYSSEKKYYKTSQIRGFLNKCQESKKLIHPNMDGYCFQ